MLGFGKVMTQSSGNNPKNPYKTSRYIVQDIRNLFLIILLFNGNIILPSKKIKLFNFINAFNERFPKLNRNIKFLVPILFLDYNLLPTKNDC
jgi:hypothetical protein